MNKKEIASKMPKSKAIERKKGNYSIFKIEDGEKGMKHYTKVKHNLTASEMRHELKNNSEYRGGKGYGFGGARSYGNHFRQV